MSRRSVRGSDVNLLGLSLLLGRHVRLLDGRRVGRVLEVTAVMSVPHPRLDRVGIGTRRAVRSVCAFGDLVESSSSSALGDGDLVLRTSDALSEATPDWAEGALRLNRDVLDCQIIDLAGKRVARVCEVFIERAGRDSFVVGVEVGAAGVLRRLGLQRIAGLIASEVVDWDELSLTKRQARTLQLADASSAVQRLEPTQLATVLAHVPIEHAIEILHTVVPTAAAGALSAAHTSLGTRLMHALPHRSAATFVDEMHADDAAPLLRALPSHDRDAVLNSVRAAHAETLRGLINNDESAHGSLEQVTGRGRFAGVKRGHAKIPQIRARATRTKVR
ncbi:MAG: hypothetical protein WCK14_07545 [Actinomycetota bacterium]|jgi:hypothetical protein